MTERKYIEVSFADITFSMEYTYPVTITRHFEPFLQGAAKTQYQVLFQEVERLPLLEGEELAHKLEYQVIQTPEGLIRQFHDPMNGEAPYAVTTYDWENRKVLVRYLKGAEKFFCETGNSFFHVGWENVLLREKKLILHAACVDTGFGGVLFSGVSGAGKSTQAELWCRYRNAEMINGDRPILGKRQGVWRAYGSPYAGSSKCHKNTDCKVRTVIMVKKSPKCRIRRLGVKEAFQKIYAQVTVYHWDKEYVSEISSLILELLSEIPVYEMECTPDIHAVELLEETLQNKMLPEEENL